MDNIKMTTRLFSMDLPEDIRSMLVELGDMDRRRLGPEICALIQAEYLRRKNVDFEMLPSGADGQGISVPVIIQHVKSEEHKPEDDPAEK
jgi:hypothetical protein